MRIGYRALGLLALGAAALAAAGAVALHTGRSEPGPVDEAEARAIFAELHRSIYRAFGSESESAIYDALSESVDGRLLDRIYAEVYEALVMRDQGGGLSTVQEVDVLDSRVLEPELAVDGRSGFRIRATWEVMSSLVHEGHEHVRVTEYEGIYTIARGDAGWRIVEDKILSQRPVPYLALPDSL